TSAAPDTPSRAGRDDHRRGRVGRRPLPSSHELLAGHGPSPWPPSPSRAGGDGTTGHSWCGPPSGAPLGQVPGADGPVLARAVWQGTTCVTGTVGALVPPRSQRALR